MAKSTHFTGQPIFNQILSLIPRSMVNRLSREHKADRYCKKFRTYDHLVTMLYASFQQCSSLREVITGMQASAQRLSHLGLKFTPRRSTLSDANERRNAALFQQLYHQLYCNYYGSLPDSLSKKKLYEKLFIIDSTIITLFSTVMQSTGSYGLNGKKKGGIKAHVLMRAKDNLPCFVDLTQGKASDSKFLPLVHLPPGSVVVMDKGYRSFQQYIKWTKQNITWVNRMNERFVFKVAESLPVNEAQQAKGVRQECVIELGNPKTSKRNAIQRVRLITFYHKQSNQTFEFITNNFTYSAATIADIYKKRWDIEIFFKRIKQNFQLHFFLGDNENAIRIQVWCSLIADLLIKVIKDKIQNKRAWAYANLAGLIRLHLGTYIKLKDFLLQPEKALIGYQDTHMQQQLSFFQFQARGA